MAKDLITWVSKVEKLAFNQIQKLKKRGMELFPLLENKDHQHHAVYLGTVLQWLTVPFTLWYFDFAGVARLSKEKIDAKEEIDPRLVLLLKKVEELPPESTQQRVAAHEFDIENGNHGKMLKNSTKYDAKEKAQASNPRVIREWEEIKSLFDVTKYRNAKTGIIRHTLLTDRGFRPSKWDYKMAEDKERWLFQAFFDLYCARNFLFGMEFDTPLLERLTVIRTIFGTHISVPRYMRMNAVSDVNWDEFDNIHEDDDTEWGGPKASEGQLCKQAMLRIFHEAHEYAEAQGWKGDERWGYVEKKCGLRPGTDRGTLRRLRKQAYELWEKENG